MVTESVEKINGGMRGVGKGVIEALEWRVGRMEECLSVLAKYFEIRMPESFYENDDADEERDEVEPDDVPSPKVESLRQESRSKSYESPEIRHNAVGDLFSIKLVRPSFFHEFDFFSRRFEVGFASTKAALANRVEVGDFMFIYVMSPEKKIIGMSQVVERATFDERRGAFPYRLLMEWEAGPKSRGLTFAELGLKVRPRVGDTVYSIESEKAADIAEKVRALPDMSYDELRGLRDTYPEAL